MNTQPAPGVVTSPAGESAQPRCWGLACFSRCLQSTPLAPPGAPASPAVLAPPSVPASPAVPAPPSVPASPAVPAPPSGTASPAVPAPPSVTASPAVPAPPSVTASPAVPASPSVTASPAVTAPPSVTASPAVPAPPSVTASPPAPAPPATPPQGISGPAPGGSSASVTQTKAWAERILGVTQASSSCSASEPVKWNREAVLKAFQNGSEALENLATLVSPMVPYPGDAALGALCILLGAINKATRNKASAMELGQRAAKLYGLIVDMHTAMDANHYAGGANTIPQQKWTPDVHYAQLMLQLLRLIQRTEEYQEKNIIVRAMLSPFELDFHQSMTDEFDKLHRSLGDVMAMDTIMRVADLAEREAERAAKLAECMREWKGEVLKQVKLSNVDGTYQVISHQSMSMFWKRWFAAQGQVGWGLWWEVFPEQMLVGLETLTTAQQQDAGVAGLFALAYEEGQQFFKAAVEKEDPSTVSVMEINDAFPADQTVKEVVAGLLKHNMGYMLGQGVCTLPQLPPACQLPEAEKVADILVQQLMQATEESSVLSAIWLVSKTVVTASNLGLYVGHSMYQGQYCKGGAVQVDLHGVETMVEVLIRLCKGLRLHQRRLPDFTKGVVFAKLKAARRRGAPMLVLLDDIGSGFTDSKHEVWDLVNKMAPHAMLIITSKQRSPSGLFNNLVLEVEALSKELQPTSGVAPAVAELLLTTGDATKEALQTMFKQMTGEEGSSAAHLAPFSEGFSTSDSAALSNYSSSSAADSVATGGIGTDVGTGIAEGCGSDAGSGAAGGSSSDASSGAAGGSGSDASSGAAGGSGSDASSGAAGSNGSEAGSGAAGGSGSDTGSGAAGGNGSDAGSGAAGGSGSDAGSGATAEHTAHVGSPGAVAEALEDWVGTSNPDPSRATASSATLALAPDAAHNTQALTGKAGQRSPEPLHVEQATHSAESHALQKQFKLLTAMLDWGLVRRERNLWYLHTVVRDALVQAYPVAVAAAEEGFVAHMFTLLAEWGSVLDKEHLKPVAVWRGRDKAPDIIKAFQLAHSQLKAEGATRKAAEGPVLRILQQVNAKQLRELLRELGLLSIPDAMELWQQLAEAKHSHWQQALGLHMQRQDPPSSPPSVPDRHSALVPMVLPAGATQEPDAGSAKLGHLGLSIKHNGDDRAGAHNQTADRLYTKAAPKDDVDVEASNNQSWHAQPLAPIAESGQDPESAVQAVKDMQPAVSSYEAIFNKHGDNLKELCSKYGQDSHPAVAQKLTCITKNTYLYLVLHLRASETFVSQLQHVMTAYGKLQLDDFLFTDIHAIAASAETCATMADFVRDLHSTLANEVDAALNMDDTLAELDKELKNLEATRRSIATALDANWQMTLLEEQIKCSMDAAKAIAGPIQECLQSLFNALAAATNLFSVMRMEVQALACNADRAVSCKQNCHEAKALQGKLKRHYWGMMQPVKNLMKLCRSFDGAVFGNKTMLMRLTNGAADVEREANDKFVKDWLTEKAGHLQLDQLEGYSARMALLPSPLRCVLASA